MSNPSPSTALHSRRSIRRVAGSLTRALIGAYGLNLTLFLALRGLLGEQWTVIALLNSLLHLLLLPALILLPVCLLLRRWGLALTLLPAAATFALSYGLLFLPRPASAAANAPTFTLLTYNLHAEIDNLDPMVEIIRQADADIVALQELSPAAAERFAAEFTQLYPYHALHPGSPNPIVGQGLLSRYLITADHYWQMHLGHQRAALDVGGAPITLYNVHPIQPLARALSGFALREEEITQVLERAEAESSAVVLAGDFNMSDQSGDYGRVAARYHDAYREAGWGMGFTWPSVSGMSGAPRWFALVPPLVRLDYVFHSDHLQALEARVGPSSGGSDHRPLWARLAIQT